MNPVADTELIARCLDKDAGAWQALVDRYADLVYGIARRAGLDDARGQDVVQDVFLALLKNLGRLRQHDRLMGWIVKAARRESWRVARRARSARSREEGVSRPERDVGALPADALQQEERRHLVRRAMRLIDGRCQRLLDALFLREVRDYQALSVELAMPVGSIGPTRRRCLDKLADALHEVGIPLPDVSGEDPAASGGVRPGGPRGA
jgi:RNA polymerase sigma factor (sigma-70 family)